MNQNRLRTVILTIFIGYTVIVGRLFYWQIIKYDSLRQKIIGQNYKSTTTLPKRGEIFDSQNYPMVLNKDEYSLSLYKPDIKINLQALDNIVTPEDKILLDKFESNPNQKWLTLKDSYQNDQIKVIKDPGITFTQITKRFYPEKELGNIYLGQIINQIPFGGLEAFYQKQLKGKAGFNWESKDATGKTILTNSSMSIDPINGRDLYTSINRQTQYLIEKSLKEGVQKFSADSGSIIVMSPQTGSIIAMGSFTASISAEASASAKKNTTISDLFEPGSIFKPLVMSMALDTNSISDDFICTKCDRPKQIGQYAISNWDSTFHANTDLKDIIKNSDNIGMSYIIEQLGLQKFLKYFQLLNLDKKTGIDLQGEVKPVQKTYWPEIDLATGSFGQGFAITQIQMISAFNSIANEGMLVTPHLVDKFEENNKIVANSQNPPLKIFKTTTVSKIKKILQYSVENGVVAKFKPANLEVCAKSGTSQVAVKGGYSDSSTIASYIGFSPCINPKFTMIVTINNPRSSPWGSSTAAPVWYEIASKLGSLL